MNQPPMKDNPEVEALGPYAVVRKLELGPVVVMLLRGAALASPLLHGRHLPAACVHARAGAAIMDRRWR